MTEIIDQPPPVANTRRPTWELVIEYAEQRAKFYPSAGFQRVHERVVADMRDRDRLGRERYGTPLQAGNGRNNLVDAYQELQDFVVYMRNEMEDRGVDPSSDDFASSALVALFADGMRMLYTMRELIGV